jgi:small subunit ribosomal protein S21
MIIIKVGKGESLDKALKRYKYKVISTKQIEQLKKRQSYIKKTTLKREKLRKAKYVQKMKQNEHN